MVRALLSVVVIASASACSSSASSSGASPGSAKEGRPARVAVVDPPPAANATTPPPTAPAGQQKMIDIALRSSPSGAVAAVDGVPVGTTPIHHAMAADGKEHYFTFDRPGFMFTWYRFVPVQSGVIHARLNPVAVDERNGAGATLDGADSDDVRQTPEAQEQPVVPALPPPPAAKPTTKVGPEP